ncbi:Ribonucleotide reductase-related [Phytophthora cactorum]|nr:Ribonucleotide reductase-related [Phytophthora cactorum]
MSGLLIHFKRYIKNIPAIHKKAVWGAKYINDCEVGASARSFGLSKEPYARVGRYNKSISRDEHLHYEFTLCLFNKLRDDPQVEFEINPDTIVDMVQKAVAIETEFINESIPCAMIGMNSKLMTRHIQYVADHLLIDIDMQPMYNVANPFSFIVALGVPDRANYFEMKETIYAKPTDTVIQYDSDNSDF